ncbi:spondin domain-containing protein [Cellvibrio mixtus]|uniref:spondin domain-containing protein n=1 Tax=Cellvibrio mixtus TaxID=39650 RepID=UPI0005868CB0|nr:spondin domain-containing protein [Cellvibrio mixtus]
MKKNLIAGLISLSALPLLMATQVFAADYSVKIENLTHGTYFAPLLVSAHPVGITLFTSGMPASISLQKMAEGGDISGLEADLMAVGATNVVNPAAGLLMPGKSTIAHLANPAAANTQLSIVAMMVPTNDGFVTLNNLTLPTTPGIYTYLLNAYDAGTEANNEIRGSGAVGMAGMPVPPPLDALVGTGGAGIGATAEGFVHIHRGVLGDHNLTGGMSDINASSQRWLNPVARVTITVQ